MLLLQLNLQQILSASGTASSQSSANGSLGVVEYIQGVAQSVAMANGIAGNQVMVSSQAQAVSGEISSVNIINYVEALAQAISVANGNGFVQYDIGPILNESIKKITVNRQINDATDSRGAVSLSSLRSIFVCGDIRIVASITPDREILQ